MAILAFLFIYAWWATSFYDVCLSHQSSLLFWYLFSFLFEIRQWCRLGLVFIVLFILNKLENMNISKATGEQKLQLCRTYFRAGFALLPFLWAVNFCWFFKEAFTRSAYPEQKQIKQYVIYSGLGTLFWTILLTTWIIIFQTQRSEWGEVADYMSFIIPLGKP